MADIDIFNGDADGLCALTQLRLAEPRDARRVTGIKRDIALVAKADIRPGDRLAILDISFEKNREALLPLLDEVEQCLYIDHHFAGEVPEHDRLHAIINTAPEICTSLLANVYTQGAYPAWAVVGAFGDNLRKSANALAKTLDLDERQLASLENLGILLNYNAYGASLDDLHFDPADLYEKISRYDNPLDFLRHDSETFEQLNQGYQSDLHNASGAETVAENQFIRVIQLPDEAWARRIGGVFGNQMANENPDRAHAILTQQPDDVWLVSVRAPINRRGGADEVCRQFETGGGRAAAAGINRLPDKQLPRFIDALNEQYN